jgi:thioredoxin-like negative regulator of GroEL
MATVEVTMENFEPALTGGGPAAPFGISSIPTVMVIRDGVVLYAQSGALPEQALEQLIARAREIDMDQVRKDLATPAAS